MDTTTVTAPAAAAAPTATGAPAATATTTGATDTTNTTDTSTAQPHSATVGTDTASQAAATPPAEVGAAQAQAGSDANPAEGQASADSNAQADAPITITFPEGAHVDQATHDAFVAKGKELGMTGDAMQQLADWHAEQVAKGREAHRQAGETYLKQLWGPSFAQNMETSRKAAALLDSHFGGRITSQLVNSGLADTPVAVEIFHWLGEALSEDSMAGGSPGTGKERELTLLEHVQLNINKAQ